MRRGKPKPKPKPEPKHEPACLGVLEAAVAVALCVTEARGRRPIPRRLARVGEPRLVGVGVEVGVGVGGWGLGVRVSHAWLPSMVRCPAERASSPPPHVCMT